MSRTSTDGVGRTLNLSIKHHFLNTFAGYVDMPLYRKKALQQLDPWTPETEMGGVSVSEADAQNGSPMAGDMIATNLKDGTDRWLVAAQYFADNYELAE